MRDILRDLSTGALSIDEAESKLKLFAVQELEGIANLDVSRSTRLGRPDIVRCHGKTVDEAVTLALAVFDSEGSVILSTATADHAARFAEYRPNALLEFEARSGLLTGRASGAVAPSGAGVVAIVTAGTSDLPVALQVQIIARFLGTETALFPDVGISGLHRLFPVVRQVIAMDPDAVVVIAGQEGGLAPVLAGLIDMPIIGVPTSTGSGFGGLGVGALTTMLQACSMGIAVVNIDNGIAGGLIANTIARRAARRRR